MNNIGGRAYNMGSASLPCIANPQSYGAVFHGGHGSFTMTTPDGKNLQAIYVSGVRRTIGALGTKAEVCLVGKKLYFQSGVMYDIRFGDVQSLIIEFKDKVYHYAVENHTDGVNVKTYLEPKLISVIEKSTPWYRKIMRKFIK